MKLEFTVDVLGQPYDIKMVPYAGDPTFIGSDCQGFTDTSDHTITIQDFTVISDMGDPVAMLRRVVRHELVHAFMEESGLSDNWTHQDGQDETIVDWIAIQWHKIDEAISEVYSAIVKQNKPGEEEEEEEA